MQNWFAISMALIGVIVGYTLANITGTVPVPGTSPTLVAPPPTPTAPPPAAPDAKDVPAVDANTDHIRGNVDAEISLIEYSDFECPFCKRHHPTAQQIVDEYDGKVNWVYRHYPLGFHPNAQKGAEASECVAELGGNDKFWEFADMVFEKGPVNDQYASYAADIGLDKDKIQDCIDSGKFASLVKDQMDGGSAAGVSGTPGNIVLNNKTGEAKIVSGAQPFANFKTVIDGML